MISAVLVVGMLFEGWPVALLRPAADRALALALALNWITSASLSFAGAGIILHVGIGLR